MELFFTYVRPTKISLEFRQGSQRNCLEFTSKVSKDLGNQKEGVGISLKKLPTQWKRSRSSHDKGGIHDFTGILCETLMDTPGASKSISLKSQGPPQLLSVPGQVLIWS